MSRRLNHLKESHSFFIKTSNPSPDTEKQVLNLVDESVLIYPKYVNKGHAKATELKQIEKKAHVTPKENGVLIEIDIHVYHYTKLYFDIYSYIAQLTGVLKLPPASISIVSQEAGEQIPVKKIVTVKPSVPSSMFI